MKKIRVLLLLALTALSLCGNALATEYSGECGAEGGNITWHLDTETGVLTLTGEGEMASYRLNAPWYTHRLLIEKIIVGDGITKIGSNAFVRAENLYDVQLTDDITDIEDNAFSRCSTLFEIDLPDNLKSLGDGTFSYCSNLVSLKIPNEITEVPQELCKDCTNLERIEFHDNITTIGKSAFFACKSLTSIKLPDSVERIESGAFCCCGNLTTVDFSSNLKYMGTVAFAECTKLTEIDLPKGLTEISNEAFWSCSKLKKVNLRDGLTKIGEDAFDDCAITEISIPKSVNEISKRAFAGCTQLKKTTILGDITLVSDSLFSGCRSLLVVTIPASVTSIGQNAFANTALQTVYFEGSEDQWNEIFVFPGNEILETAEIIFASAEKIESSVLSGKVKGKNATAIALSNGKVHTFTPDEDGSFAFENLSGKVQLTLWAPGCLTHTIKNITVEGTDIDLGTVTLLAGDTNGDDMINIMDMGAFRANFGKVGANITNEFTDVNGDGMVNIMDMGTFRANFGKTAAKDCTVILTDPVEPEWKPTRLPMLYSEMGEVTQDGTEVFFYSEGERATWLMTDTSPLTRTGLMFWGSVEGEVLTVEPVSREDENVIAGKLTYVDGDYLEIDGRGMNTTVASVYQMNNAGTKMATGKATVGKNVVAFLDSYGDIVELYQYKQDILAW